ncbi:MAG: hypothetical protein KGJ56_04055 [Gammaproteobacteria bacterium]|nr:hypothetical protein [Gammaproteobacteria bacterium]
MNLFDPTGWIAVIRSASPGDFWFWTTCVCAAAVAAFFATFHFFNRARLIEDIPQSLIRSAAQGYVELQGRGALMPGAPIIAPLTGTRCLWWACKIEERGTGSKGRGAWQLVSHRSSDDLFCMDDGTGQCVIDPEGAEVFPSLRQVWYGDTPDPIGGPKLGSLGIGSRYRYEEQRIHDGDPLYALGYFHTQGGGASAADINEEVRQLLVEWKKDQAALLRRFDKNHDGQVDMQEWDLARTAARQQVLESEREAVMRPPVNLLARAPDGRPFILSDVPQKKLEGRFRLWAAACLAAFLVSGAAGVFLVTHRLQSPPAAVTQQHPDP